MSHIKQNLVATYIELSKPLSYNISSNTYIKDHFKIHQKFFSFSTVKKQLNYPVCKAFMMYLAVNVSPTRILNIFRKTN